VKSVASVCVAACAALAVGVSAAGAATNECKGLQVCVPVAGPWVVATSGQTAFQLDCPRRFVIGGLDAELSDRAIDIGFVGGLGSPVNPGITTTGSAVFLGRFVGRSGAGSSTGSFRPHIGCIPASGGGQRAPTAYHVFKPGKPVVRVVKTVAVHPGTQRLVVGCATGQRLVSASHAVGFYTGSPPSRALISSIVVHQVLRGGRAHVTVHAGLSVAGLHAAAVVVQVDLVCAVTS
jgi:hypothetical protein